jgi:hypothetical protein
MKRMVSGRSIAAAIATMAGLAAHMASDSSLQAAGLGPATTSAVEPSGEAVQANTPEFEPEEHDLSQFFPNLRMPPVMASVPEVPPSRVANNAIVARDFAAIVAEAKREAMAEMRSSKRSVAAALPGDDADHGTPASFASFTRPTCRHRGTPAPQSCPPQQLQPPKQPTPPPPSDMGSATPPPAGLPFTPAAPDAAVLAVPDLSRDLPPAQSLARGNEGRRGANWSDSPWLVGDGCAPNATGGQISVGRIMIQAQGLTSVGPNTLTNPSSAAQMNLITNPAFNSVKAIEKAGYPTFALPSQPLGSVAGTPPTTILSSGGDASPQPAGTYLAAAQNAFQSNPNLNTNGKIGTAKFDAASSGVLPGTSGTDAFLFVIIPGYAVGFVKLTENMSPIPRDRVYMNYSYFHNANLWGEQADINRFMPGFEKTFYDGWTSIELRTPFAATLDNFQDIQYPGGGSMAELSEYRDIQFGNMSVIFKTLLWEQQTWAFTAGVQVMLPTANNSFVYGPTTTPDESNIQQIFVANESVHVMPFVGGIWAPNERFFSQALLQFDRDCNGNLAYVNTTQDGSLRGRQLTQAGRLFYPTFMYASFGSGYWLYKDNKANFTGFSPILEVHVNQALEDFDPLCFQGYQLGTNPGVISVVNGLVGCNFEWGTRSTLTFAYVTPLGGGLDRFFDGEVRALYNLRFGPQNRLTRAQF